MAGSIFDWSTTAGSNATADGDINWAEGQLPSTVNDSARTMMKRVAEYIKDHGALTLSGTDTLTVTANSAFTAYATGRQIVAKVANTNTSTTVTLNVNGIGAKRVKVVGTAGETDPEVGTMRAGQWAIFNYDAAANAAAGAWILLNPLQSAALTGAQPLDADLTAIAALATTDGNFIVANGSTWVAESGATARASLGLTIGTDVQAYDADLAGIAALTSAANKVPYSTGAQAWALADFTTTGRAIVAATIAANQVLYGNGTNTVTTATLTTTGRAIIAATITTDQLLYGNGANTVTTTSLTAAGRAILDDADASAQRTTLGLGTVATQQYTTGTWTPTLAFGTPGSSSMSYNEQTGSYVRIGNVIIASCTLTVTPTIGTGSGTIRVSLPVTCENKVYTGAVGTISRDAANDGLTWPSLLGGSTATAISVYTQNNDYAFIRAHGSSGETANMTTTALVDGTEHTIAFSITYVAA